MVGSVNQSRSLVHIKASALFCVSFIDFAGYVSLDAYVGLLFHRYGTNTSKYRMLKVYHVNDLKNRNDDGYKTMGFYTKATVYHAMNHGME